MTAEQRSACMGDYEKYCKGVAPGGGRIIACLAKESDKITPACKEGADGRREEMRRRLAFMPAVDRTEIGVHARRDRIRRTLRRNFQERNFQYLNINRETNMRSFLLIAAAALVLFRHHDVQNPPKPTRSFAPAVSFGPAAPEPAAQSSSASLPWPAGLGVGGRRESSPLHLSPGRFAGGHGSDAGAAARAHNRSRTEPAGRTGLLTSGLDRAPSLVP